MKKISVTSKQWDSWTLSFKQFLCEKGTEVTLLDDGTVIYCEMQQGRYCFTAHKGAKPDSLRELVDEYAEPQRDGSKYTNLWFVNCFDRALEDQEFDNRSDHKEMLPSRRDNIIEFLVYDTFRKDRT